MAHIDQTVEPAVITLHPHEVKDLPLLKWVPIVEVGTEFGEQFKVVGPQYDYSEFYNQTIRMMDILMINYRSPLTKHKLEDIPQNIQKQLKPFACFLAIMDGNDYKETVDQYIPIVYAFMTNNGHRFVDEALDQIDSYCKEI